MVSVLEIHVIDRGATGLNIFESHLMLVSLPDCQYCPERMMSQAVMRYKQALKIEDIHVTVQRNLKEPTFDWSKLPDFVSKFFKCLSD